MEQNQSGIKPHHWNEHAAYGDAVLLGLLVRQDQAWQAGAEQRERSGEVTESTRTEIRELAEQILAREQELGIDPLTVGASLDQVPEALDN